jgi:BirA family biotin operon repressor/biotin-[acetyl-CoA-carboxylase] ligase
MPDSPAPISRFSATDLARLPAETFIDRVEYCEVLPSTSSRALELASAHDGASVLVIADRQTAGRGRGAKSWWSDDGALTFSVLLCTLDFRVPVSRWPLLSLTTGLAICEAIEATLPGVSASIKWPNDVYVDGRKACGILVEGADARQATLVVGIGVNVNNSVAAAPAELRDKAVALCDVAAAPIDRAALLVRILERLAARFEWLATDADELLEVWSRRSFLTGRRVEIELPGRSIAGLCCGIDSDGALLVDTAAGLERCLSGVVARFD